MPPDVDPRRFFARWSAPSRVLITCSGPTEAADVVATLVAADLHPKLCVESRTGHVSVAVPPAELGRARRILDVTA